MLRINSLLTAAVLATAVAVAGISPAAAATRVVSHGSSEDVSFTLCGYNNAVSVQSMNGDNLDFQIWWSGKIIYQVNDESYFSTILQQYVNCDNYTLRVINNDAYDKEFWFNRA